MTETYNISDQERCISEGINDTLKNGGPKTDEEYHSQWLLKNEWVNLQTKILCNSLEPLLPTITINRNRGYLFEFGDLRKSYALGTQCDRLRIFSYVNPVNGEISLNYVEDDGVGFVPVSYIRTSKVRRIYEKALQFITKSGLSLYNDQERKGFWRSLMIRVNHMGESLLEIKTGAPDVSGRDNENEVISRILKELKEHFQSPDCEDLNLTSLIVRMHCITEKRTEVLFGSEYLIEDVDDLHILVDDTHFSWWNPSGAKELCHAIVELSGLNKKWGVFQIDSTSPVPTLFMAKLCKSVALANTTLKSVGSFIYASALKNNITNYMHYSGPVKKVYKDVLNNLCKSCDNICVVIFSLNTKLKDDKDVEMLRNCPKVKKIVCISSFSREEYVRKVASFCEDKQDWNDPFVLTKMISVDMSPYEHNVQRVYLMERHSDVKSITMPNSRFSHSRNIQYPREKVINWKKQFMKSFQHDNKPRKTSLCHEQPESCDKSESSRNHDDELLLRKTSHSLDNIWGHKVSVAQDNVDPEFDPDSKSRESQNSFVAGDQCTAQDDELLYNCMTQGQHGDKGEEVSPSIVRSPHKEEILCNRVAINMPKQSEEVIHNVENKHFNQDKKILPNTIAENQLLNNIDANNGNKNLEDQILPNSVVGRQNTQREEELMPIIGVGSQNTYYKEKILPSSVEQRQISDQNERTLQCGLNRQSSSYHATNATTNLVTIYDVNRNIHHMLNDGVSITDELYKMQVKWKEACAVASIKIFSDVLRSAIPTFIKSRTPRFIFKVETIRYPVDIPPIDLLVAKSDSNDCRLYSNLDHLLTNVSETLPLVPFKRIRSDVTKILYQRIIQFIRVCKQPLFNPALNSGFWKGFTIRVNSAKQAYVELSINMRVPEDKKKVAISLFGSKLVEFIMSAPQYGNIDLFSIIVEVDNGNETERTVVTGEDFLPEFVEEFEVQLKEPFLWSNPKGIVQLSRAILSLGKLDSNWSILQIGLGYSIPSLLLAKTCKEVYILENSHNQKALKDLQLIAMEYNVKNMQFKEMACVDDLRHTLSISLRSKQNICVFLNYRNQDSASLSSVIRNNPNTKQLIVCTSTLNETNFIQFIVEMCTDNRDSSSSVPFIIHTVFPVDMSHCENDVQMLILLIRKPQVTNAVEGNNNTDENQFTKYLALSEQQRTNLWLNMRVPSSCENVIQFYTQSSKTLDSVQVFDLNSTQMYQPTVVGLDRNISQNAGSIWDINVDNTRNISDCTKSIRNISVDGGSTRNTSVDVISFRNTTVNVGSTRNITDCTNSIRNISVDIDSTRNTSADGGNTRNIIDCTNSIRNISVDIDSTRSASVDVSSFRNTTVNVGSTRNTSVDVDSTRNISTSETRNICVDVSSIGNNSGDSEEMKHVNTTVTEQSQEKKKFARGQLEKLSSHLLQRLPQLPANHSPNYAFALEDIRLCQVVDSNSCLLEVHTGIDRSTGKISMGYTTTPNKTNDVITDIRSPHIRAIYEKMMSFINTSGYELYNPITEEGLWMKLVIRTNCRNEALLLIVYNANSQTSVLHGLNFELTNYFKSPEIKKHCNVVSLITEISHTAKAPLRCRGYRKKPYVLYGNKYITDIIQGFAIKFYGYPLTWTYPYGMQGLCRTIIELAELDDSWTILQIGSICDFVPLHLANVCRSVRMFCTDGRHGSITADNARSNHIKNFVFHYGSILTELRSTLQSRLDKDEKVCVLITEFFHNKNKDLQLIQNCPKIKKIVFMPDISFTCMAKRLSFLCTRGSADLEPFFVKRVVPVELSPAKEDMNIVILLEREYLHSVVHNASYSRKEGVYISSKFIDRESGDGEIHKRRDSVNNTEVCPKRARQDSVNEMPISSGVQGGNNGFVAPCTSDIARQGEKRRAEKSVTVIDLTSDDENIEHSSKVNLSKKQKTSCRVSPLPQIITSSGECEYYPLGSIRENWLTDLAVEAEYQKDLIRLIREKTPTSVAEYEPQLKVKQLWAVSQAKCLSNILRNIMPVLVQERTPGLLFEMGDLIPCPLTKANTDQFQAFSGVNASGHVTLDYSFGFGSTKLSAKMRDFNCSTIGNIYHSAISFIKGTFLPLFNPSTRRGFWNSITVRVNHTGLAMLVLEGIAKTRREAKNHVDSLHDKLDEFYSHERAMSLQIISLILKVQYANEHYDTVVLFGKDYIEDVVGNFSIQIVDSMFHYPNPYGILELGHAIVKLLELDKSWTVIHFGFGDGITPLYLSSVCKEVVLLERSNVRCSIMKRNIMRNSIKNMSVIKAGSLRNEMPALLNNDLRLHNNICVVFSTFNYAAGNHEIANLRNDPRVKKIICLSKTRACPEVKKVFELCRKNICMVEPFVLTKAVGVDMSPFEDIIKLLYLLERQSNLKGLIEENENYSLLEVNEFDRIKSLDQEQKERVDTPTLGPIITRRKLTVSKITEYILEKRHKTLIHTSEEPVATIQSSAQITSKEMEIVANRSNAVFSTVDIKQESSEEPDVVILDADTLDSPVRIKQEVEAEDTVINSANTLTNSASTIVNSDSPLVDSARSEIKQEKDSEASADGETSHEHPNEQAVSTIRNIVSVNSMAQQLPVHVKTENISEANGTLTDGVTEQEEYNLLLANYKKTWIQSQSAFLSDFLKTVLPNIVNFCADGLIFLQDDLRGCSAKGADYGDKFEVYVGVDSDTGNLSMDRYIYPDGSGGKINHVRLPVFKILYKSFMEFIVRSPYTLFHPVKNTGLWKGMVITVNECKQIMTVLVASYKGENSVSAEMSSITAQLKQWFEAIDLGEYQLVSLALKVYCGADENETYSVFGDKFLSYFVDGMNINIHVDSPPWPNSNSVRELSEAIVELCSVDHNWGVVQIGYGCVLVSLQLAKVCDKVILVDTFLEQGESIVNCANENGMDNVSYLPSYVAKKQFRTSLENCTKSLENVCVLIDDSFDPNGFSAFSLRDHHKIKKIVWVTRFVQLSMMEKLHTLCSKNEKWLESFVFVRAIPVDMSLYENEIRTVYLLTRESVMSNYLKPNPDVLTSGQDTVSTVLANLSSSRLDLSMDSDGHSQTFDKQCSTPIISRTPSLSGLHSSTPTPSLSGLQSSTPTPSLSGLHSSTPTPSLSGLHSSTPTPSLSGLHSSTPTPSLSGLHSSTPTPSLSGLRSSTFRIREEYENSECDILNNEYETEQSNTEKRSNEINACDTPIKRFYPLLSETSVEQSSRDTSSTLQENVLHVELEARQCEAESSEQVQQNQYANDSWNSRKRKLETSTLPFSSKRHKNPFRYDLNKEQQQRNNNKFSLASHVESTEQTVNSAQSNVTDFNQTTTATLNTESSKIYSKPSTSSKNQGNPWDQISNEELERRFNERRNYNEIIKLHVKEKSSPNVACKAVNDPRKVNARMIRKSSESELTTVPLGAERTPTTRTESNVNPWNTMTDTDLEKRFNERRKYNKAIKSYVDKKIEQSSIHGTVTANWSKQLKGHEPKRPLPENPVKGHYPILKNPFRQDPGMENPKQDSRLENLKQNSRWENPS